MKIAEVVSGTHKKDFLKVPKLFYKGDEFWVCPLDIEIESIFDPEKNNKFKGGEATRWVLYGANGDLIGRVAAFLRKIMLLLTLSQPVEWVFSSVSMMKMRLLNSLMLQRTG